MTDASDELVRQFAGMVHDALNVAVGAVGHLELAESSGLVPKGTFPHENFRARAKEVVEWWARLTRKAAVEIRPETWVATHRNIKTGELYRHISLIEDATNGREELPFMVLYENSAGYRYARDMFEFQDKFEKLDTADV